MRAGQVGWLGNGHHTNVAFQKQTPGGAPRTTRGGLRTISWSPRNHQGWAMHHRIESHEPPGVAQEPSGGVQEPPGVGQEPSGGVQEPPGVAQEPSGGVQEPPGVGQQPSGGVPGTNRGGPRTIRWSPRNHQGWAKNHQVES
jgi:hypothetical protein